MYRNRASIISHSASTCLESGIFSLRGSKNTHIICGICFVLVRFLLANMFSNNLPFIPALNPIFVKNCNFISRSWIRFIRENILNKCLLKISSPMRNRRGWKIKKRIHFGSRAHFFAWRKKLIESAFCVINFLILNRDGQTRTRVRFGHGLGHEILWTSDARSDPYISEKLGHG